MRVKMRDAAAAVDEQNAPSFFIECVVIASRGSRRQLLQFIVAPFFCPCGQGVYRVLAPEAPLHAHCGFGL